MSRVLGDNTEAIKVLPATTASGLAVWHEANIWVVTTFIALTLVSLAYAFNQINRYFANRKSN